MHGPGKGPSCSGLRMVPNISGYYNEERANTVLQVKKRQTHRRAIGLLSLHVGVLRPHTPRVLTELT